MNCDTEILSERETEVYLNSSAFKDSLTIPWNGLVTFAEPEKWEVPIKGVEVVE